MRAWAMPKPVPSKPTFMAPSVVSWGLVARLGCIMAQASDNHARHGSGKAISWSPLYPARWSNVFKPD
jgi:hypothetical protein